MVRNRSRWLRGVAVFSALLLLAAACGDDDDEAADTTTTTVERQQVDHLLIGQIHPETGTLAFLNAPQVAGVDMALEDINAAGGVLGNDVEVIRGDEAGDAARARDAAARLLGQGAQVFIGAASSSMTDEFIQTLSDEQVPQCSPSNTSPKFTDQENADFYIRTVPPDNAVAPVIADTIAEDGHSSIAIAALADDYGQPLADLVEQEAEELGIDVTDKVLYPPDATNFDSEVETITADNPDAVVIISFNEGAVLIRGLIEAGMDPENFYGADGIFAPTLPAEVNPEDPSVVDGMKVIGAAGTDDFLERLSPRTENNLIYGGQSYDCAIILALAVEEVGDLTDGPAILEAAINVTKDGTKCTTFAECKDLIGQGEDIDYDGASGELALDDVGDPTVTEYAIGQYQEGGTLTPTASQTVNVAEVIGGGDEGGATTTTTAAE